jgi:hypothetical protein
MPVDIFFQVIEHIIEGEDWRAPIMAYLRNYYELDNRIEQIRMKHCAKDYRSLTMGYIRPPSQAPYSDASVKSKARKYSKKYMQEFEWDTSVLAHSQARSYGKDFIG